MHPLTKMVRLFVYFGFLFLGLSHYQLSPALASNHLSCQDLAAISSNVVALSQHDFDTAQNNIVVFADDTHYCLLEDVTGYVYAYGSNIIFNLYGHSLTTPQRLYDAASIISSNNVLFINGTIAGGRRNLAMSNSQHVRIEKITFTSPSYNDPVVQGYELVDMTFITNTIPQAPSGVLIHGGERLHFSGNSITASTTGLYVQGDDITIEENTIVAEERGIEVMLTTKQSPLAVRLNTVRVESSQQRSIFDEPTVPTAGVYGIHVGGIYSTTAPTRVVQITDNDVYFRHTTCNENSALIVESLSNAYIYGNLLQSAHAALRINNVVNTEVIFNTLENIIPASEIHADPWVCSETGFVANAIDNTVVKNNTIYTSRSSVTNANGLLWRNNQHTYFGHIRELLYVQDTVNMNLEGSIMYMSEDIYQNFTGSPRFIRLINTDQSSIWRNTFTGGPHKIIAGLFMSESDNVTVSGNKMQNAEFLLYLVNNTHVYDQYNTFCHITSYTNGHYPHVVDSTSSRTPLSSPPWKEVCSS